MSPQIPKKNINYIHILIAMGLSPQEINSMSCEEFWMKALDIDSELDWEIANLFYRKFNAV